MTNKTTKNLHRVSAIGAMLTICSYLISSLVAEISSNFTLIYQVKAYIVFSLPLLVIFMMLTVFSGQRIGNSNHPVVKRKLRRLKIIGTNGTMLVILAVVLYLKASRGSFDSTFWILQAIELIFGFSNIVLMVAMAVDGMRLSGRIKKI